MPPTRINGLFASSHKGNILGLFDQLAGDILNKVTGGEGTGNLAHTVLDLIGNHEGGLSGLVEKLKAGGLGEQVASWIGAGGNLPVSAEQIQAALGSGVVADLAAKAGIDPAAISGQVASLLPGLIDKLTPDGQVGEHSAVQDGLSALAKLFG